MKEFEDFPTTEGEVEASEGQELATEEKEESEELEEYRQTILLASINLTSDSIFSQISETEPIRRAIGLDTNLPNIGITFNNKLVELQREFKKSGLSIYTSSREEDEPSSLSFVGSAVMDDLKEYHEKGHRYFEKYYKCITDIKRKLERLQEIPETNPSVLFFTRQRRLQISAQQERESLSLFIQEEKQVIRELIADYKEIDNQLWNYNLRDNILSSIVKEVRNQQYSASIVTRELKETIHPDLEKLGLADLLPKLRATLKKEYERDLLKYQISEEEAYRQMQSMRNEGEGPGDSTPER